MQFCTVGVCRCKLRSILHVHREKPEKNNVSARRTEITMRFDIGKNTGIPSPLNFAQKHAAENPIYCFECGCKLSESVRS